MPFFNQRAADFVQHIAVVLEITALGLIISDLYIYRADRGRIFRRSVARMPGPVPDRSLRILWGIRVATVAVLLELYQLATLYFG